MDERVRGGKKKRFERREGDIRGRIGHSVFRANED